MKVSERKVVINLKRIIIKAIIFFAEAMIVLAVTTKPIYGPTFEVMEERGYTELGRAIFAEEMEELLCE